MATNYTSDQVTQMMTQWAGANGTPLSGFNTDAGFSQTDPNYSLDTMMANRTVPGADGTTPALNSVNQYLASKGLLSVDNSLFDPKWSQQAANGMSQQDILSSYTGVTGGQLIPVTYNGRTQYYYSNPTGQAFTSGLSGDASSGANGMVQTVPAAGGQFDSILGALTQAPMGIIAGVAAGGALGLGGLGGGGAAADTLGGGSFLAANDAAMAGAGSSALGTAGMYGAVADTALGGGLAGAGLGAAGAAGTTAALSDFGLSTMGSQAATGLGIDAATSPFSFNTGSPIDFGASSPFTPSGGGPWNLNASPPLQNNSWNLNPTTPDQPFQFPSSPGTGGMSSAPITPSTVVDPSTGMTMTDVVKKYGLDAAQKVANYLQNKSMADKLQKQGQQAANVMGQPERQPFLNEAQQIAQGNLGAGGTAIQNAVAAQAAARAAKYGYGGTENSKADVMLAQELAKYGNDRLNALLGYTGANQSTSQTAYMAARDSAAFMTQSYQGFTALAAKIGADAGARGAIGKAAEEFGSQIMSFFA